MEEEPQAVETEQAETVNNEGETSEKVSNSSPIKRGRGRPQGSKKLKVCVTDVNLTELMLAHSNGGSTPIKRGRGRPKLSDTKHTDQQGSPVKGRRGRPKGSKKQTSSENHSPRKRGRPRKSAAGDLPNGGSATPRRGRPKGSGKRKSESLTSGEEDEGGSVTPRKRGRPKGSGNKKPRLERDVGSEGDTEGEESLKLPKRGRGRPRKSTSNGITKTPGRGRGRPRKQTSGEQLATDGSLPVKRGRGRPKGSVTKKPPTYKVHGKVGRPRKVHALPIKGRKRGRPRQQPAKRGRPRKHPLPTPEELKRPKVWKPLGRPRKYPRVDPPEGAPPAPRRSRGRPRKSDSKKGAHLRKVPATPHNPDEPPRKRGRPPKSEDNTPRKRGRPKGSVNKNKATSETQLDSTVPNHSKPMSDSSADGVENETEPEEVAREHNTEAMAIKHGGNTEETLIDQDVSFDVSSQA